MSDTDAETEETPEQAKARRVEAFAARGPRYRRWADAFIGADDPIFAIACEVVDHELRIDGLANDVLALKAKLNQRKGTTP